MLIGEFQRLRDGFTQCIGCGCVSIDKCRLANPADQSGRRGPGPRLLAWLVGPTANERKTWNLDAGLLRRRGLRRALERGIVTEHKHDDGSYQGAGRKEDEASEISSGPIAQYSKYFGSEKTAEIADRIYRGDTGRRSCSAQEGCRKRPENW
jgi:hypothetical protein